MALGVAQALRAKRGECIAFVGAGGKTTAMFRLARELTPPVIVTTTTHVGAWQAPLADRHVVVQRAEELRDWKPEGVDLVTGPRGSEDRFGAVSHDTLARLRDIAEARSAALLIEADGAHERPLKAPEAHEPNIPPFVGVVAVLAGLRGLGKPLDSESVHRPQVFARLGGLQMGQTISPEALARVLRHPEGGLKNVPAGARRVVLLNQADSDELRSMARGISHDLLGSYDAVVIASLEQSVVHAVIESVAGIVLAAGGSTRLGRPKALLDWRGQPFVRAVASKALEAGLRPVIVVTGSGAADVEAALQDLPVKLVRNVDWQLGQASSIGTGVQAIPASDGAAIFLLADQPQVTTDVLTALVDLHSTGMQPIVAPLVMMERRANPVLFDRVTFPDLLALTGDVGGRAIFDKHRVEYLPWHDDRLLLDVDTEADYRRLLEDDTL